MNNIHRYPREESDEHSNSVDGERRGPDAIVDWVEPFIASV